MSTQLRKLSGRPARIPRLPRPRITESFVELARFLGDAGYNYSPFGGRLSLPLGDMQLEFNHRGQLVKVKCGGYEVELDENGEVSTVVGEPTASTDHNND